MTQSTSDPFALARLDGDDAILTLFREWRDGMERLEAAKLDDDEYDPLHEALIETMRQIFDAEASGLIGLSIKAFMLGFEAQVDTKFHKEDHPCSIHAFEQDQYGAKDTLFLLNHALKGLITDVTRFVPELAPLTARITSARVVLPPDDESTEDAPDPLPALVAERNKIWHSNDDTPADADSDKRSQNVCDQVNVLENCIADMVAPSADGILAQFELLMELVELGGWADGRDERLIESIKAGLRKQLPADAGAAK